MRVARRRHPMPPLTRHHPAWGGGIKSASLPEPTPDKAGAYVTDTHCPIVALLCHTTHCNLPGILCGAGKMTYALPAPQACFGLFSGMFTALPYVIAR